MIRGHPILYAVLGFLVYPIGGGIAGFLYAQSAREINELRGIRDESLAHNPFFAVCIGLLLAPFSGAVYGYMYGKKEVELADLKNAIGQESRVARDYGMAEGRGPARERGSDDWRNRVQGEVQSREYSR